MCSLLSKDEMKLVILVYSNPCRFNCLSTRAKRRWSKPIKIPMDVTESRGEVIWRAPNPIQNGPSASGKNAKINRSNYNILGPIYFWVLSHSFASFCDVFSPSFSSNNLNFLVFKLKPNQLSKPKHETSWVHRFTPSFYRLYILFPTWWFWPKLGPLTISKSLSCAPEVWAIDGPAEIQVPITDPERCQACREKQFEECPFFQRAWLQRISQMDQMGKFATHPRLPFVNSWGDKASAPFNSLVAWVVCFPHCSRRDRVAYRGENRWQTDLGRQWQSKW